MSISQFSPVQRELLADLVLLGIYSDGHLAVSEDAALNRLLEAIGPEGAPEREAYSDAAISRVRRLLEIPAALEARLFSSAIIFPDAGQRAAALHAVNQALNADGKITTAELKFHARLKASLEN